MHGENGWQREQAVRDWSEAQARLYKLRRARGALDDAIDVEAEQAACLEAEAARLIGEGEVVRDGKRYTRCMRDGLEALDVAPVEECSEVRPW